MNVIGMSMVGMNLKRFFTDRRVFILIVYKMILLPIITYFIFSPFIANDVLVSILVVIAAMPGPAMATSFAAVYDNNVEFSTKYVAVSTVLSMVLIPAILAITGLS